MYYQQSQLRFQPFVANHTNHHEMLRSEVHNAIGNGDYQYAAIASQFLDTNYDDWIV